MVTDEIQELLEGTMRDDRMAELLHTLSVSPEKRRAFREYLTLNREIKEDRYASALTLGEDAALWKSIAAAGAVGTTVATTAGRSVGIWIGRAAALLVVGIAGYLLGSETTGTTTLVRQETGTPVAVHDTRSGMTPRSATPQSTTLPDAAGSTSGAHATPSSGASAPITANVPSAGAAQSTASQNTTSRNSTPRSTTMLASSTRRAAGSSAGSTNGPAGPTGNRLESAQQMFDALGSGSSWSVERWAAPAIVEQPPVDASADGKGTSPATTPADTSKSAPTAALMRKMPEDIPIEGEEPAAPTSTLFRNGFEASFSEHNGLLPQSPGGTENPDRSFAYRTIDLSYRLNGGKIGFGARIGYGTFSHITLEAKPETVSDFNGLTNSQIFVDQVTATEQVITEAFINYRHPLFERFALELEASIGGSKSHQQGAVDMSLIGFLTESVGLQLGGGAGTYWYNSAAMKADALNSVQTDIKGIDNDVRPKYQGIMLLAHYGIFYRF